MLPLPHYLAFLLSLTWGCGVGVNLDARNSRARWLFDPTLPPPTRKKKKKEKERMKENPRGTSTPLKLSKLLATFLIDGDPDLFLLIVVKVTRVPRAFKLWYEGSFHLERDQESPRAH